jgi:GNAT superfamily N-acetyltransferase
MEIQVAEDDAAILSCFPLLKELRPHLLEADFLGRVRRQMKEAYRLAYGVQGREILVCAGFRECEHLFSGAMIYVDDLVTRREARSQGHGRAMLQWIKTRARERGCKAIHLDSGTQRKDAHAFYLRERYRITSFHFVLDLEGEA